jgi:hypothetical protein
MKKQEKQWITAGVCGFSLGFHTADVHSISAMMYRGTVGIAPGWAQGRQACGVPRIRSGHFVKHRGFPMKTLKIAVGLSLLVAGLSACAENSKGLYSSGEYYNSFGRGYYQPYQDGSTFHYHHSYYAKANTVAEVGE